MLYRLLRAWFLATPDLEARVTIATQDQDATAARAELIEALMRASRHAHRQPYVIEKFEADRPTQWTKAHRYIDTLLDQYEATR